MGFSIQFFVYLTIFLESSRRAAVLKAERVIFVSLGENDKWIAHLLIIIARTPLMGTGLHGLSCETFNAVARAKILLALDRFQLSHP